MDTLLTNPETKSLHAFCADVLLRHKDHWPLREMALAEEFVERFSPEWLSSTERLIQFASGLGIKASLMTLPHGLHGFNYSTEEETGIFLKEQESFPGSHEHTLFHELREIMEYCFRDHGSPTATGKELEKRAEEFAMDVRLMAGTKNLGTMIDGLKNIETTWKRVLAGLAIVVGVFGLGAICALLPYFEDNFPVKE